MTQLIFALLFLTIILIGAALWMHLRERANGEEISDLGSTGDR